MCLALPPLGYSASHEAGARNRPGVSRHRHFGGGALLPLRPARDTSRPAGCGPRGPSRRGRLATRPTAVARDASPGNTRQGRRRSPTRRRPEPETGARLSRCARLGALGLLARRSCAGCRSRPARRRFRRALPRGERSARGTLRRRRPPLLGTFLSAPPAPIAGRARAVGDCAHSPTRQRRSLE